MNFNLCWLFEWSTVENNDVTYVVGQIRCSET